MCSILQYVFILFLLNSVSCNDDGYVHYSIVGVSYKFHKSPLNWLKAKMRCNEEGAKLAMPKDEGEALLLKIIFGQYPNSALPDMPDKDYILMDSHDMFQDGEFLTQGYNIQYFYHTFHSGEPNGGKKENCLVMKRDGKLHDYSCEYPYSFICQKEDKPYLTKLKNEMVPSHDPAYKYHSHSGKFFKLHMDVRDWPTARAICQAEGGHLAIVQCKQEEIFLANMFNDPQNQWKKSFNQNFAFIGFHDLYEKGTFHTVDDRRLEDVGYVNWGDGEPNHESAEERCGSIAKNGKLNDYSCTIPLQFFCEIVPNFHLSARNR